MKIIKKVFLLFLFFMFISFFQFYTIKAEETKDEKLDSKILSLKSLTVEIVEGEEYRLPEKITAVFSDGEKEVPVKWDNVQIKTNTAGTYTINGKVEGCEESAKLILIIKPKIFPTKVEVSKNLSKIFVCLNKKVDKKDAIINNIQLYDDNVSIKEEVKLIDEKTICLTVRNSSGKLEKDKKYKLSLVNLKDINNKYFEPFSFEFVPSQVLNENIDDTISAGFLKAPEVYSPLGQFLYFGNLPINADKMTVKYDNNHVPMIKIYGKNNFVYNPIAIAQYGLQYYSYFIKYNNKDYLKNVIAASNWFVANQDRKTGKWLYNFPFYVDGMGITLKPGWASAMGQGQIISLLVRAYDVTKDENYIKAAELGLKPLKIDVKDGGLKRTINGYTFYEEYPTIPPSYALNGFMFTLFGLYDLSYIRPQSEATALFKDGMKTLSWILPQYDYPKNKISIYHLGYKTDSSKKIHTSKFYHSVHIIQLKAMYSIMPEPVFMKYYNLWSSYIKK
ncbi:MAG: D-glucuronyl C5-epimerase family protein [Caloramator sp.]|nr:D-glucuronyl C5-epimerase family protein [Caloramator sp.]